MDNIAEFVATFVVAPLSFFAIATFLIWVVVKMWRSIFKK